MYQIDGIDIRREKCLANSMVIMGDNKFIDIFGEQHRKKLKNIINPV